MFNVHSPLGCRNTSENATHEKWARVEERERRKRKKMRGKGNPELKFIQGIKKVISINWEIIHRIKFKFANEITCILFMSQNYSKIFRKMVFCSVRYSFLFLNRIVLVPLLKIMAVCSIDPKPNGSVLVKWNQMGWNMSFHIHFQFEPVFLFAFQFDKCRLKQATKKYTSWIKIPHK